MLISGKQYMQVNERISEFRKNPKYEGYTLTTEILEHKDGFIMMKALVKDMTDRLVADGIAYEINEAEGSNKINLTSYIENCQTSAWGRALGNLGIGVDASIASAEEVKNAIKRQETLTNKQIEPQQNQNVNSPREKLTGWTLEEIGKDPVGFNYGDKSVDYRLFNKDGKYFWAIVDKANITEYIKQYMQTIVE